MGVDKAVNVTVTGAAGQIGYASLFRIASGQMFGSETPVRLKLLEVAPAMKTLEGVAMELADCSFSLLESIEITDDITAGFDGANVALLIGSAPRKEGMERGDLLSINGHIFEAQGKAINDNADDDVRVLVVGNPCNTNCLIARSHAPDIPNDRWFAMMKLDETRAKAQLATKSGSEVSVVTNLAVWGNHSATQFPDFNNARIGGRPVTELIDEQWLKSEFLQTVQQRGAKIIQTRGSSSAASAGNAVLETIRSLCLPTAGGDVTSVAAVSSGQYGVPEGLVFGFPVISKGDFEWQIDESFDLDEYAKSKIQANIDELVSEREEVRSLGLLG